MKTSTLLALVLSAVALACASPRSAPTEGPPVEPTLASNQPTAAPAAPAAKTCDSDLVQLLSAPHDPPTSREVDAVCADPVPALARIASDAAQPGFRRLRATGLLGHYPTAAAQDALAVQLRSGDLASLRRTAVAALTRQPPSPARDSLLRDGLRDTDPHVRAESVRALERDTSDATRAALVEARRVESVPFVKELLDRVAP